MMEEIIAHEKFRTTQRSLIIWIYTVLHLQWTFFFLMNIVSNPFLPFDGITIGMLLIQIYLHFLYYFMIGVIRPDNSLKSFV